jgi:hypothetical protein
MQRNVLARSRNHCCHRNVTIRSLFIAVDLHVAVNNIKVFSVTTETQKWVPFALFSTYKLFRTPDNNINVELCALLGYYAASNGNPLPTFRDSVSVPQR